MNRILQIVIMSSVAFFCRSAFASYYIVIMGQSNAVDMGPNYPGDGSSSGYLGIYSVLGDSNSITINNCAVNGSHIAAWLPTATNYINCKNSIGDHKVDAMFFYQGEQEAFWQTTDAVRNTWLSSYTVIATQFHQDFNCPVIHAQLASTCDVADFPTAYWNVVKTMQANVAIDSWERWIRTDDISPSPQDNPDCVHFPAEGIYVVGQRFANTFLRMQKSTLAYGNLRMSSQVRLR